MTHSPGCGPLKIEKTRLPTHRPLHNGHRPIESANSLQRQGSSRCPMVWHCHPLRTIFTNPLGIQHPFGQPLRASLNRHQTSSCHRFMALHRASRAALVSNGTAKSKRRGHGFNVTSTHRNRHCRVDGSQDNHTLENWRSLSRKVPHTSALTVLPRTVQPRNSLILIRPVATLPVRQEVFRALLFPLAVAL